MLNLGMFSGMHYSNRLQAFRLVLWNQTWIKLLQLLASSFPSLGVGVFLVPITKGCYNDNNPQQNALSIFSKSFKRLPLIIIFFIFIIMMIITVHVWKKVTYTHALVVSAYNLSQIPSNQGAIEERVLALDLCSRSCIFTFRFIF